MKSNILLLSLAFGVYSVEAKKQKIDCLYRANDQHQEMHLHEIEHLLFSDPCTHICIEISNPFSAIACLHYLEPLHNSGKSITILAPLRLHKLLSWCPYITNTMSEQNQSMHSTALHITMEQLVQIMQKKDPAVTNNPSLIIDETVKSLWQNAFITDTSFKIGVCCTPWFDDVYKKDTHSFIDISSFFPLACMQHTGLYSLDDLSSIATPDVANLYYFDKKHRNAFTDLATIISFMDLVITTEPLIVDVAHALGKEAWFITSHDTDAEIVSHTRTFRLTDKKGIIFDIMHELAYLIQEPTNQVVTAEIATGELIDKMTILQIKQEHITDPKKLDNISKELHSLQRTFDTFVTASPELKRLTQELKAANEALWITEDLIRDKEREKCFDAEFILLARSVYIQNDERCRVKREINELLGSRLVEEKSYKPYN